MSNAKSTAIYNLSNAANRRKSRADRRFGSVFTRGPGMAALVVLAVALGMLAICSANAQVRPAQAQALNNLAKGAGSAAARQMTPLGQVLNADGTLNLGQGFSGNLDTTGWNIDTTQNGAPHFSRVSSTSPGSLATDAGSWDNRFGPAGTNGVVAAIAISGDNVFVGGGFTTAGGITANNVAEWNGTTGTWSSLGTGTANGTSSGVDAIAIMGTDIYVGGFFITAGGITVNHIARWSTTSNSWFALNNGTALGVSNAVSAMAVIDGDLYVGGAFNHAGGMIANNVAEWNPSTNTWSSLGTGNANGTNSSVYALAALGTDLYAGGLFDFAGGAEADFVAVWHQATGTWAPLEEGGMKGVDNVVTALAVISNDVYVGGAFSTAGTVPVKNVAEWNPSTSTWSSLGTSSANGTNNTVHSLSTLAGDLYVGGEFTRTAGLVANDIAEWNPSTSTWSGLSSNGINGTSSGQVDAIAAQGNSLYAGGEFTTIGQADVNYVADWDVSAHTWSGLGEGFATPQGFTHAFVNAIAISGEDVYVGGYFTSTGGIAANSIAVWNATTNTWSSLGTGIQTTGATAQIFAIAVLNGNVYVGGDFNRAGGMVANSMAEWNPTTSTWSSLGTGSANGTSAPVFALAVIGSDLYAGGSFFTAGGIAANYIARWSTTSNSWFALNNGSATGTNSNVEALAAMGSNLFVGGIFTTAGGANANHIAEWHPDSNSWSYLNNGTSTGTNNIVLALAVSGTDVYAGGDFTMAGGVTVNYIARWSTTSNSWSILAGSTSIGTNGQVNSIVVLGSDVYASGSFSTAGGVTANYVAYWSSTAVNWFSLGTGSANGTDAEVYPLALLGTDVYVGGDFFTAGGLPAYSISIWHSLGNPTPTPTATVVGATPTLVPTSVTSATVIATATATATAIATSCPIQFTDVPQGSTFYDYIRCLACKSVLNGYSDTSHCAGVGVPCFLPNASITRGQAAKIIAGAAGYSDIIPANQQSFVDVPPSSTFWVYVERVHMHGVISGYPCGGAGEPCPGTYYRPGANLTRGQLAKIATIAAGFNETPTGQSFVDVPPSNAFYVYVERAHIHNIISGYPCGGSGEPCPGVYFRPGPNVTRGQASKIVAGTFFPGCVTP